MKINKLLAFILISGFAVSWTGYFISTDHVKKVGQVQFDVQTDKIRQIIVARFEKNKSLIRSTQAMLESRKEITKEQWEHYARVLRIEQNHPGLADLGFVSYVSGGNRSDYFPVILNTDIRKNKIKLGFDIGSDPVLRAAVLKAHDSGRSSMSGRIELGSEDEKVPAFLICLSVYKTVKEQKILRGWVVGIFLMEDLMREIKQGTEAYIDVEIYDGATLSRNTMMYDGDGQGHALNPNDHPLFTHKTEIPFAGRTWTLYMSTGPAFSMDQTGSWLTLFGGMLLSILLVALYSLQLVAKKRAKEFAAMTEQQKMNQLKNEFISTVSHELRTPLTSIKGALGLISGGFSAGFPEKAKPLLQVALANCDRLVRLVDDILDVEKIESGKINFQIEAIDIGLLIKEAALENATYAQEFGVEIEVEDLVPDYAKMIMGSPDRLNQVLTNLISNAVKSSPRNEKVIVRASEVSGKICVQVIDYGSGIPEDFKGRIFQKFAQANCVQTGKNAGTGLGLSISKAIIEKMGGTIGFNSSSKSTEFYFYLNVSKHA